MAEKIRKSGKKNRKWGRDKVKCARYRSEDRRFKHKVNQLFKKWKTYAKQPPKALFGIKDTNQELYLALRQRFANG